MIINISERADLQVKRTALYIQCEFGNKSRGQFTADYRHVLSLLRNNPRLGPVEQLLEGMPGEHRSIVFGHLNKLVYRINGDVIDIVDLWDTRRDPSMLAKGAIG